MKILTYILLAAGFAFGAAADAPAPRQLYTCGMHPQIIRDAPGYCPICGMKLQPVRAGLAAAPTERKVKYYQSTMTPGEVKPGPGRDSMGMDMVPVYEEADSSPQNAIQIDAATIQRMNLRTALVEHGPVLLELRTVGAIVYDERGLSDVTMKYDGWLEKLYVNATWTSVKAGDALFEVYSPDVYNAELNYLVALQSEGEAGGPLTRAASARLRLFDVPSDVLSDLARSREARRTLVFRAPADGTVIEKMAVQGQMMKAGEPIYRLANLATTWAEAQIYEKDLPYVHDGQPASVRMTYGSGQTLNGTVQLVLPQVEDLTRAATARIVLPNPDGLLRPGMFVDVRFTAKVAGDAVLVPDMAVLRSGERDTVFVALEGGRFEAREVRLGARSEGGLYQVLDGLHAGERVVTSGQFMLDSESQLQEAIQKMLGSAPAASADTARTGEAPAGAH
jgi:hypothetical protein